MHRSSADELKQRAQAFKRQKPVMLDFISHKLDVYNNRELAETGVTHSQAKILVRLYHSPEQSLPQSELKSFGRQGPTITSTLAKLESAGLIYRKTDEKDGRAKYVGLTEKGAGCALAEISIIDKEEQLINSVLSEEEQKQFKDLLAKVADSLFEKFNPDKDNNYERNDEA